MVETGPKASILWQSVLLNGSLFKNKIGGMKAPLFLSAPTTSNFSKLPNTIS